MATVPYNDSVSGDFPNEHGAQTAQQFFAVGLFASFKPEAIFWAE